MSKQNLAGLVAAFICAAIVYYFHNRFWWPPDDGTYGYVADRMLRGAVLHRDVHDVHAGYINFVHVGAMWLFGVDLLSMRYPLAALTFGQCVLTYMLLAHRGSLIAFAAAISCAAFSFIQFINPSANWYIPPIATMILVLLTCVRPTWPLRVPLIGMLLMVALLFRQLNGVFLIMGTVTCLLLEHRGGTSPPRLARAILASFAILLAAYLALKPSVFGILVFGVWPLALLFFAWRDVRMPDLAALRLSAGLVAGAIAGAVPMAVYVIHTRSAADWFSDVIVDSVEFGSSAVLQERNFTDNLVYAVIFPFMEPSMTAVINTAYWLAILLAPAAVGWVFARRLRARGGGGHWQPVVVVPVFLALAAIHYQIALYLYFVIGLTIFALLALAETAKQKALVAAGVLALSLVAVTLHAGRPISRGIHGAMSGESAPLDAVNGLTRASVAMEAADAALYGKILAFITANTKDGERIAAIPYNPEFYYLSRRDSVFKFLSTSVIRNESDYQEALRILDSDPPKLIVKKQEDKYHTEYSARMMAALAVKYRIAASMSGFEIYLPR